MGEVYLARRRAAGVEKWLVVKRMRPERAGDARFLDLFMREARLTMSLAHQNIVPVFDFGRIDDQVFLAMERVEGKDLGSSLAKAGKGMPPLLAAFIAAECCQALDYAHHRKSPDGADLGIVHRDVTPRNVLLSWSGEVKLTDFGIASLAGDEPSKMAGTPAYMAPEQARGESLDVRADIYAIGMVLREALTGERGRRGTDRETVLAAAQQGTLDPWPDGFESPLVAIVDRATAIAKEDRYPDARAMLAELDEFIVAERAANKGESPARQLATWLAEIWEGERDDVTISDLDIEANHLLSFLDDGPFDVVGTGTQRSMAMTAAEEPEPPPAVAEPEPVKRSESSPAAEARPAAEPARRSRAPWIVLAALLAGAGAVAIVLTMRHDDPPERPAPPIASVEADARVDEPVVPEATPDAAPIVEAAPADAAVPDAPTRVKPRHPVQVRHEDKQIDPPPPPPVATKKYKVLVSTRPTWSYFTVDDDATKHQTFDPIILAPGKHTLHFIGHEYFKADKTVTITVPEQDGFKVFEKLDAPAPKP
jgi:serine/threonine protein kinase